jgi:hypothetical protein
VQRGEPLLWPALNLQHLKQPECARNKSFQPSVSLGKRVNDFWVEDDDAVLPLAVVLGMCEEPSVGHLLAWRLDSSMKISWYHFLSMVRCSSILRTCSIHSFKEVSYLVKFVSDTF